VNELSFLPHWDPKLVFGIILLCWLGGTILFVAAANAARDIAYHLETLSHEEKSAKISMTKEKS
jgi:hypothetical protein